MWLKIASFLFGICLSLAANNGFADDKRLIYVIPSNNPGYDSGSYDQGYYPYQPTYTYNPNVYGGYNPYLYNPNTFNSGYGYNPLGFGMSKGALQAQAGMNLVGALINTIMTLR